MSTGDDRPAGAGLCQMLEMIVQLSELPDAEVQREARKAITEIALALSEHGLPVLQAAVNSPALSADLREKMRDTLVALRDALRREAKRD